MAQPITQGDFQTPPICPKCQEANKKKRHIICNTCSRAWHLGCLRLSRAQAAALSRWTCPECLAPGRGGTRPRPGSTQDTPNDAGPDGQPGAGRRSVNGAAAAPAGDGRVQPAPAAAAAAGDVREADVDAETFARHLAEVKKSRRVVPRIPRGARIQAADALCELVEGVVKSGSALAWFRLLMFAVVALSRPVRAKIGQRDTSLTTKIKQQIAKYMCAEKQESVANPLTEVSHRGATERCRLGDQKESLKRRVSEKLADGDVRGAIRLLSSADQLAEDSEEVMRSLQGKHPPAPADFCLPPEPTTPQWPIAFLNRNSSPPSAPSTRAPAPGLTASALLTLRT